MQSCSNDSDLQCPVLQDTDLEREVRKRQRRAESASFQRWRWLFVLCIGTTVAVLSMVVNLGIAGLTSVKIKATEGLISATGVALDPSSRAAFSCYHLQPGQAQEN